MHHLPRFSLAAVSLALAPVASTALVAQQRVVTAADYARAERALAFNTTPLVFEIGVTPTWLDANRFTYSVQLPDRSRPTYLVDAAKATKVNCSATPVPAPCAGTQSAALAARRAIPLTATRSPDGKRTAYIRNWNLYVADIATNTETQVTFDGVKDFGYATDNAGWTHSDGAIVLWSPDSKKIATFQQDQRNVQDMYLVSTKAGHPEMRAWKYPLPGDSVVSMISRVVIDLSGATPKTVRLQMAPDQHRSTVCDHISCVNSEFADVQWYPDGSKLAFVSSTRDHKVATLRIADATTGVVRDVLRAEHPIRIRRKRAELAHPPRVERSAVVLRA
jgi:dipeptidyl-peptidase-4